MRHDGLFRWLGQPLARVKAGAVGLSRRKDNSTEMEKYDCLRYYSPIHQVHLSLTQ